MKKSDENIKTNHLRELMSYVSVDQLVTDNDIFF